ncbi:MAG: phosphate regulon transcriptional regulator PhoB [Methylococcales bacterium]|nr:phosphate regulon transcriptional regulator PhoB [Methylococcales bacterium]
MTILVVEDEEAINEMLVMILAQAGFKVFSAMSAEAAQTILGDNVIPNLILLDWMLPDISGIEFAKQLKKDPLYQEIPIILLTARGEEEDKIKGLEMGADDYVTKPFSPRELIARIKAVIRRSHKFLNEGVLTTQMLSLNIEQHYLMIGHQKVDLSPMEFKLLAFFMSHQNKVYSRTQLLDRVWGRNIYIEERTVDVHIRRLRKILDKYQQKHLVQTVRGFGYRFSIGD